MTTNATPNTVPKEPLDWFQWMAGRMRILERHRHASPDVTTTTSAEIFASVATGWTMGSVRITRAGDVISFSGTVTRSGATISGATALNDGNITNVAIATFADDWRPAVVQPLTTSTTGSMTTCYVDTAGIWAVSAVLPNIDWVSGTARALGGTWIALHR
jgi:hypothetical protein